MSGQQENSDLVRSESKREMESGAFQEILEMISWGRRHSIELTVGMFGVTMIYAFGYMTFSGLPLSLFGVNSGIKVAVLFSLVIITAFVLFYLFAISGVVCGAFVARVADRSCDNKSVRMAVFRRCVIIVSFHALMLTATLFLASIYLKGFHGFFVWISSLIGVIVFPSLLSWLLFFGGDLIRYYHFLFYLFAFFFQSFVDLLAVVLFEKLELVSFSGGRNDVYFVLICFFVFGGLFCLFLFVSMRILPRFSIKLIVNLVLFLICFSVLCFALYFPVGSVLVQRVLRVSAGGTGGCSVILWSGALPDGLKVLDNTRDGEYGVVGAGRSVPVYVENELGDNYVVTVKKMKSVATSQELPMRQFYFVHKSFVSGMEDCPKGKVGNK